MLLSTVNTESEYVRKEPFRKRGPYLEDAYADVDEEEEEYGDHRLSMMLSINTTQKERGESSQLEIYKDKNGGLNI